MRAVKDRFAPDGLDASSDSPQEFAAFPQERDLALRLIAKIAGMQPE
jgi:hypothetical protein